MMNWWSQTTTDCNWLIGSTPLNTQTYLRILYTTTTTTTTYIPDSTNYKSTASGANKSRLNSGKDISGINSQSLEDTQVEYISQKYT